MTTEPENLELEQHRRRLPRERQGFTHKFTIRSIEGSGVIEGYVTGNTYTDGKLGEIFIAGVGKEGSTVDGFVQAFALEFSIALQYGAPLETMCLKLARMKFDPRGPVIVYDEDGNIDKSWPIDYAHSVPAYIAEWIAQRWGDDELIDKMRAIREMLNT